MKEKKEKTFYKKWWFWLLIGIILVTTIFLVIYINNKPIGVGTAGISKEEFDKIEIGKTTNFELNSIIDQNNEWNNDEIYERCVEQLEEKKEEHKYTYIYKYYGEEKGYAIITLQADYSNGYYHNDVIVVKKENVGL